MSLKIFKRMIREDNGGALITGNEFGQVRVKCHEIYLLSELVLLKRMGSYKLWCYQS